MARSGLQTKSKPITNAWATLDAIINESIQKTVQPGDITTRLYLAHVLEHTGVRLTSSTAARHLNRIPGLTRIGGVYDPATHRVTTVWRPSGAKEK